MKLRSVENDSQRAHNNRKIATAKMKFFISLNKESVL